MGNSEILLKMLAWIAEEQRKAALPGGEPFVYTSLRYCATQVAGDKPVEDVVQALQATAKMEGGTTDAVRPHRAIFLINRTLATLA